METAVADRSLRDVYARQAANWDSQRGRQLFERGWLQRVLAATSENDTVIDVGCGAGEPIARYFIENRRKVCGVDFARPMLDIAASRFPQERWIESDMRALDLGERFAALVAWDSFFHLTADEQRSSIPRLCRHVRTGGPLLVTVGPRAGEAMGTVGGEAVYHASLSIEEYTTLFQAERFEVLDFKPSDPDCAGHSVLLAVSRQA